MDTAFEMFVKVEILVRKEREVFLRKMSFFSADIICKEGGVKRLSVDATGGLRKEVLTNKEHF